jgi:CrcB protein
MLVVRRYGSAAPYATLIVNLIGCAVIGLLAGLLAGGRLGMTSTARVFVFVGILGGFTTFSSFGLDVFTLARTGRL